MVGPIPGIIPVALMSKGKRGRTGLLPSLFDKLFESRAFPANTCQKTFITSPAYSHGFGKIREVRAHTSMRHHTYMEMKPRGGWRRSRHATLPRTKNTPEIPFKLADTTNPEQPCHIRGDKEHAADQSFGNSPGMPGDEDKNPVEQDCPISRYHVLEHSRPQQAPYYPSFVCGLQRSAGIQ